MYHHFSGKSFIEELRLGRVCRGNLHRVNSRPPKNDELKPSGRRPLGGLLTLLVSPQLFQSILSTKHQLMDLEATAHSVLSKYSGPDSQHESRVSQVVL